MSYSARAEGLGKYDYGFFIMLPVPVKKNQSFILLLIDILIVSQNSQNFSQCEFPEYTHTHTHTHTYIYIYIYIYIYVVLSISFQIFCTCIYNCRRLLRIHCYCIWDDWPILMISASNEQLQQQLEYTLLKPDCYSWWISKMQSGREDTLEERYAIKFCFKLGNNAKETYGML